MTEKITNLDHVLDPTVGVFLNNWFNPDQGFHLWHNNTHVFTYTLTLKQVLSCLTNPAAKIAHDAVTTQWIDCITTPWTNDESTRIKQKFALFPQPPTQTTNSPIIMVVCVEPVLCCGQCCEEETKGKAHIAPLDTLWN